MLRDVPFEQDAVCDRHSKIEATDITDDCICPVCLSDKGYTEIVSNNGILGPGGSSWIEYCICKNCSVMFKSADMFFSYKGGIN